MDGQQHNSEAQASAGCRSALRRHATSRAVLALAALAALAVTALATGCSDDTRDPPQPAPLTAEELLDPESCKDCHSKQYQQWSGSMHAYAGEDPVFLAMNQRGQRETQGQLGSFCVQCHAPMALRRGQTKDGLNLSQVPKKLRGVTCITCHTVSEVQGEHNAPLKWADDGVLRGGIEDPVSSPAHKMAYSPLHDGSKIESAKLCGSCHDVVLANSVHLERTFAEWKKTLFSNPTSGQMTSCNGCHMHSAPGAVVDAKGARVRILHDHSFAAVDVALTDFPERQAQRKHIQADLDSSLIAQLCVEITETANKRVEVMLQNVAAGHSFPSGATQDRRVWVELVATAAGATIYQSGVVADDQAIATLDDPHLWLLRDQVFDGAGDEVHMFWEVESIVSDLLLGARKDAAAGTAAGETRQVRSYWLPSAPDEIKMRVRLRPIGLEVLHDLVSSGDLDPIHLGEMPTFSLQGTELTWRADQAKEQLSPTGRKALCVPKLLVRGADDPLAGAELYVPGIEKAGKAGQARFSIVSASPEPPGLGENVWIVEVRDAEGAPLTQLQIDAGTWMPQHVHGSPIFGKSEHQGQGRYRVSPIQLFMSGLWEVTLAATGKAADGSAIDDAAVFRFWVSE
jgi:nitrate/TMAO reductase-like tetraheme cytochrome c subunit